MDIRIRNENDNTVVWLRGSGVVVADGETLFSSSGTHDRYGIFSNGQIVRVVKKDGKDATTKDALKQWNDALNASPCRLTRVD